MGLDYAGKTSVITAITRKFGFEQEILKLMPTRKIARDAFKFLGIEFRRSDGSRFDTLTALIHTGK